MNFARNSRGSFVSLARLLSCLLVLACVALPAFAQEAAPDPTTTPVGTLFRWLNFALVFGGLAWVIAKFGGKYFRDHAKAIASSIHEAMDARAKAERELAQATERLSAVDLEIQELRRAAARETAAEAERIRGLAHTEVEKIGRAGLAEIAAAERAGHQELRAAAARLATERAAVLVRARMNPATDSALFHSFVSELAGSAS